MSDDCHRCGAKWTATRLILFGGVTAKLCPACENALDSLLMADPLIAEIIAGEAAERHHDLRAKAGDAPTLDEVLELKQRSWELRIALRPTILAFIEPLPKPAAEPEPAAVVVTPFSPCIRGRGA